MLASALAAFSLLPIVVIETTGIANSNARFDRALEVALQQDVPLGTRKCPPSSNAPRCRQPVPSTTTASPTPTGSTATGTTTTPEPLRTAGATSPDPSPNPPGSGVVDLPREPWHGGPGYYAQFPKAAAAGWTNPAFFPISVFYAKPGHAETLKSLGINTFMGAEHDGSSVSTITDVGISLLAQTEWTRAEVGENPRVVGWHVSDECDMGLSGCASSEGETGSLEIQRRWVERLRAYGDGRFLQANFGNGVLGTFWSPTTMDDHIALVDLSSVDKYAYTSPHVQDLFRDSPYWLEGRNPASAGAYGWQQDRMETFASPAASKPNWVFVETAKPYLTERGAAMITGPQIEGAVWNGIIHGASGIVYFQHNNSGECGTYSLVQCSQALRDTVTDVNAKVRSLAPVINTQSYVWDFGPGLETALKASGGHAYIFAMTDGSTGTRTFAMPPGTSGDVVVLGESRTIHISGGTFTDSFPNEYTYHVYRVVLD